MATRLSVRQRYPDHAKTLKIIRTYEQFAQFEAAFADTTHPTASSASLAKRVEELKNDSQKTLEALNKKPPVRIPEMASKSDMSGSDMAKIKDLDEETRQKPLTKKEFKRPGHFIRYKRKGITEPDNRYNYEISQEDFQFLTELKGSPFTQAEFEILINLFEKQNAEGETAKSFGLLIDLIVQMDFKQDRADIEKVFKYWLLLRSNRGQKPLLRKYWKPPDPSNNDPKVTFRSCKDEKRNLRRSRKYDSDFFIKMEQFKEGLLKARDLVRLSLKREEIKKKLAVLSVLDFDKQAGDQTSLGASLSQYREDMAEIEKLCAGRGDLSIVIPKPDLTVPIKPPEVAERLIGIENKTITVNFESATLLSLIIQKASQPRQVYQQRVRPSIEVYPGPAVPTVVDQKIEQTKEQVEEQTVDEPVMEKREVVCRGFFHRLDRRVVPAAKFFPVEPRAQLVKTDPQKDEKNLGKGVMVGKYSKAADTPTDQLAKLWDYYPFKDSQEEEDAMQTRIKTLGSAYKAVMKQKKKVALEKSAANASES